MAIANRSRQTFVTVAAVCGTLLLFAFVVMRSDVARQGDARATSRALSDQVHHTPVAPTEKRPIVREHGVDDDECLVPGETYQLNMFIRCDDKVPPPPAFDSKYFNCMFPADFRKRVAAAIQRVKRDNDKAMNAPFWNNYPSWQTTNYIPGSVADYGDLFGPNYGLLHYLGTIPRHVRRELRVMEYGCGLGQLYYYIKRMGFRTYTCVDPFSQSSSVNLADAMAKEMDDSIEVLDTIPKDGFDVYIHASIYWTIKDMVSILKIRSLRYFALNHVYQIVSKVAGRGLTFDDVLPKFELLKVADDKDWQNSLYAPCNRQEAEYPKHFSYTHSFHNTNRSEADIVAYYRGELEWKP